MCIRDSDYIKKPFSIMELITRVKALLRRTETEDIKVLQVENITLDHCLLYTSPLSRDCVCHNMKLTTLGDVYQCVKGTGGEEIKLDEDCLLYTSRCV